jgi:hypothetical protein
MVSGFCRAFGELCFQFGYTFDGAREVGIRKLAIFRTRARRPGPGRKRRNFGPFLGRDRVFG